MTKSSYQLQDKDQALEDGFVENKRNVVIFTHDLFDSPHTDKSLLFGDYYLFLKESLDALATISNTTTWIKIHPFSEETGCIEEVIALVKSYSTNQFKILSHTISNAQIVQLKPDLAVTARGTVALEMAFYEIPCLTSYDNPYVNFDFVYTARSKEDFFTVIKGEKLISLDYNKRMIASCYYQMYLEHWPIKENGPLTNLESIMHHAHTNEYLQALNDHNFDSWKLELSKMYGVYVQSIKQ